MHHPALGCEFIFKPLPLHMDQGALPRAKQIVLKGGEGEEVIFKNQVNFLLLVENY
jgi:hypothetical protein